jgi:uncharacterized protein (DUF58 family)
MIYAMTLRSNPRIILLYILLLLIIAAGAAMIPLLGLLFGLAALGAALFIAYSMGRLIRRQLRTRIETRAEGLIFTLYGEEKVEFPWNAIRLAGFSLEPGRRGMDKRLFVYREDTDRLFAVSREFENLDALAAEIGEKMELREVILAPGEILKQKLADLLEQG